MKLGAPAVACKGCPISTGHKENLGLQGELCHLPVLSSGFVAYLPRTLVFSF